MTFSRVCLKLKFPFPTKTIKINAMQLGLRKRPMDISRITPREVETNFVALLIVGILHQFQLKKTKRKTKLNNTQINTHDLFSRFDPIWIYVPANSLEGIRSALSNIKKLFTALSPSHSTITVEKIFPRK